MARFEKIDCFGLTEPLVGSGASGGPTTTAKREGDGWILNGEKRWIGNAIAASVETGMVCLDQWIHDPDTGDRPASVQILAQEFIGVDLLGRGDDQRIPEGNPG
jgi:alkylation response protein AidB-like acyl-CoA dehydrogenase